MSKELLGIPTLQVGGSVNAWKSYFKRAQIYGADINPNVMFEETRLKTYTVDIENTTSIREMFRNIGQKLDIFVDDSLHEPKAQATLLSIAYDEGWRFKNNTKVKYWFILYNKNPS